MADVPESVKYAALFPSSDLPPPPPEHPFRQVQGDGYSVGLFSGQTFGTVSVEALDPDQVEAVVEEATKLLLADGKRRAAWFVAEAAQPPGLAERLLAMGMVPHEEPPLEPRFAAMALVNPPHGEHAGVEARLAESYEEFQQASRLGQAVFDLSEHDRAAAEAHEHELWQSEQRVDTYRTYVALIGGEVVGGAALIHGRNASFLAGGYTRTDMRGRGVYRALVHARWGSAVTRGTPALTVGAGEISRPVLEGVGFRIVGWIDCLLHEFV